MGGPLLIFDPSGVSFFHGLQRSSLLLFSLCNYDLSDVDHDDDVMFLYELDLALEIDLPIVPSKLIVHTKNYDAFRKFQDSWPIKLPWVEFCLGSNVNLHIIKCSVCSEVEGFNNVFYC
jgi:hypothetical protein